MNGAFVRRWIIMADYRINISDELYHHGILGQRWGKRNGPPYPLSLGAHSQREKKHGTKGWSVEAKREVKQTRKTSSSNSNDENNKFNLTDNQKKAIKIGVAATATAVVVIGGMYLYKTGRLNGLIHKGKSSTGMVVGDVELPDTKSVFKKMNKPDDLDSVLRSVNPSGEHNNCYNCAVGAISRLCGYDVTARPDTRNGKGFDFNDLCRIFNLDPSDETQVRRIRRNGDFDKITNKIIKNYKDGDIGAVGCELWNAKENKFGGHTFNWKLDNGVVYFFDTQPEVNVNDKYVRLYYDKLLNKSKEVSFARFVNTNEGIPEDILSRLSDFVE